MSKPRCGWWGYVKDMIRRYPELSEQYAELHNTSAVASYGAGGRSGGVSRATEGIAIRELPSNAQREYEAVRRAIELTERYRNGRDRLTVIRMVLWDEQCTLEGAALMIPCGWRTAARWHGEFIRLVAKNYGFMD